MINMSQMHCHSEYSNFRFLDVCHKVEQLIDRAVELNAPCMALTDHETLSGAVKALRYVKDSKENGSIPKDFTLGLGNEIYLVDDVLKEYDEEKEKDKYLATSDYYHFILIAKNEVGFKQIKELSSIAWSHSFYTGKMERVPTSKKDLKEIISKAPGNVLASSACIGSELGKNLISIMHLENMQNGIEECPPFADDKHIQDTIQNDWDTIHKYIKFCLDVFGKDFRLELQPGTSKDQIYVNNHIIKLSEQYDIPYIITCDVHYLKKELRSVHEAYLNSREDEQRELVDFYESTYMMDYEEIHEKMDEYVGKDIVNKAIENTNSWADCVEEYEIYHDQVVPKATIPEFELSNSFENCYSFCPYIKKFAESDNLNDRYFLYLVEQGWWEKEYKDDLTSEDIKTMMLRINDEMEAIWETSEKIHDNVSSYYLTALEIVNMMWDDSEDGGNSFVGVSRGSIACFYTAYLINLQQINPLRYDIPYWRHLDDYLS